jgi:acyl-CoA dehydrogenase
MALEPEIFRQFLSTIRRFVKERLVPNEERLEADDRVPAEILAEMKELGLFGLSVPTEYGGLGLTTLEEVEVAFELGRTSPAFRTMIATNNGIGSQALLLDGTAAQKARYLPRIASGELIGAFALTEPGAGSDAASLQTKAVLDGGAYVLNGTKRFITNGPEAGIYTVMARTSAEQGAAGISAFVVEAGTPGLLLGPPDKKMGQRGAHTCDVIFEDCRVPKDALIGDQEGVGFKTAMKVLDRGRLTMAASGVAMAERLITDSLAYAIQREQFGKPIAEFQLIQAMLADSRTEAYAGRCMVLDAAKRRDLGENTTTIAACCKYYVSEMVGRVADRAVQIHGGAGYIADYGVERFYRDVRLMRLYEGTSQIQQLLIAKNMIKEAQGS